MRSQKFALKCECESINWVAQSQAGTSICCSACGQEAVVPPYSRLRELPSIDASPLGMVKYKVKHGDPPFDGVCQLCETAHAESVLPVRLDYVPLGESEAFEIEGRLSTCLVPCSFCHGCFGEFRRSIWIGFLSQIPSAILKSVWLLLGLVISLVVAAILPLIGFGFVIASMACLFAQLTRKISNPALANHLDRLFSFKTLSKELYYFRLKPQSYYRIGK